MTTEPKSIVAALFERVPSFSVAFDWAECEDLPHVVFGQFGLFLKNQIVDGTLRPDEMDSSFELVNEMVSSQDETLRELAVVGVLEHLAGSKKALAEARRRLTDEGLRELEQVLSAITPTGP